MQKASPAQGLSSLLYRVDYLILLLSFAYFLKAAMFARLNIYDFRFIWYAGVVWLKGISPYSDYYITEGTRLFPANNPMVVYLYPPQWYYISTALARMPNETALIVWRAVGLACTALAVWLLYSCFPRTRANRSGVLLLSAMLLLSQPYLTTIGCGQTTFLVFLGFALLLKALITQSRTLMVVALLVLTLKQHFGVPVAAVLLFDRRWTGSVIAAALIALLLGAPQFLAFGLFETLHDLIRNVGIQDASGQLTYKNIVGVGNIVGNILGAKLPTPVGTVAILLLGGAAYARLRRDEGMASLDRACLMLAALVAPVMAFTPYHGYDTFVLFVVTYVFVLHFGGSRAATIVLIASLAAARPGLFFLPFFDSSVDTENMESLIQSAATVIVLGTVLHMVFTRTRPNGRAAVVVPEAAAPGHG